ncbi:MAG TPA: hypothetical protein VHI13_20680 [Candidatus Kapabacteria bacterium]|nr:hypothetical protein [Candidatus Kapabacteria bacterium]
MDKGAEREPEFVPRLGAGCLMLIGILLAAMAFTLNLGDGRLGITGILFYLMIGFGFLGAGIFWYRYVSRQERGRRQLYLEKAVLGVAARHGGTVTLAQIVLESACSAEEAEATVDRLRRQGYAQTELTMDGVVHYRFGGLLGRSSEV